MDVVQKSDRKVSPLLAAGYPDVAGAREVAIETWSVNGAVGNGTTKPSGAGLPLPTTSFA